MDAEHAEHLKALLEECRVLSLAVLVEAGPHAGLLPYALRPDFGGFLVHASGLARHTQGLGDGAPFGVVIHAPDQADADPLQLPRVTLQGTVRLLAKGSEDYVSGREQYVAKFPASAPIFGLGDFNLFELVPERGRFISGFAGAHNIGPETLRRLGASA